MTNIQRVREESLVYTYFDGAQAEARIVAWEGRITSWMDQFERARLNPGTFDCHIALAAEMYNVPYASVPTFDYYDEEHATLAHPEGSLSLRGISKRCRHGLNYRMQVGRLATTTGMTYAAAQEAFNIYHATTPELRVWWDTVEQEVRTNRKLYNMYGRCMPFMGSRLEESLMDAIIAFKPQSGLGDLVTGVQWRCQADDDWPAYARIPFNNHDSLTALSRERDVMRIAKLYKKYAEAPVYIHGEPLIIPIEIKKSVADAHGVHRWTNMVKVKM